MGKDQDYMKMALQLALRAKGKTSPNPLVGAVIVKNNKIIGQGFHRFCGADHAEIVALKTAGARAKGATLYVTLEPCGHFGRTPPCVEAIIKSGLKRVVIGTKDPNPVNNGKSIGKLKRAGIQIEMGFLESDLKKINEHFFKFIVKKKPFVMLKWAQTLDGKIATASGDSKWITSRQSRDVAHRLRNDFDAILVGVNTVLKDNPRLNAPNKDLKKIIVDSTLRIPLKGRLYQKTKAANIIVATTQQAPGSKKRALLKKGVCVIECPQQKKRVDLTFLLKKLAAHNITSVLIEGGAKIAGSVLKRSLADKVCIFMAPKIAADQNALSAIDGWAAKRVSQWKKFKQLRIFPIGPDLCIEGYIRPIKKDE